MYDILIKRARIIDGTGSPSFWGDVAVQDGKIVGIGNDLGLAREICDADGLTLCPGFIDSHSHGDMMFELDPSFFQEVEQGVTTQIEGMCGISAAPFSETHLDSALEIAATVVDCDFLQSAGCRFDYQQYLDHLEHIPAGNNYVLMVGHGTLRAFVMGMDDREPTSAELQKMEETLHQCMEAGALGISYGLQYPPGAYASTEEMVHLSSVAAKYDGVIAAHVRDEGNHLLEADQEMIQVARSSHCKLVISHHKAINQPNWGKSQKTLSLIEQANQRGCNVYCDQYPYTASSTGLKSRIPQHLHSLGENQLISLMSDPEQRTMMRNAILAGMNPEQRFGTTMFGASPAHPEYTGKMVLDVARDLQKDPCELVMDVLCDDHLTTNGIYFCMQDEDVERIMRYPRTMIGSDGLYYKGCAGVHPRAFGTFLRVLGEYVREKKILKWEDAIRKMTSLPAQVYGLQTKGLIRIGMDADLVLFNPETIKDLATFTDSKKRGQGIVYVWIGGKCVVKDDVFQGVMEGKLLRHGKGDSFY